MNTSHGINFRTSEIAYAVDREGQIVSWNRAAENIFGYPEIEVVGKKCWELLCGQDAFGNQYCCEGCPVLNTAFNNKSVNRFRVSFKTASLEMKCFAVSALLLSTNTGEDVMVHLCRSEASNGKAPVNGNGFTNGHTPPQKQRGNLTQREHEILVLLADGNSTGEISSLLCISNHTVRNHVQHVLFKLKVSSRLKAINLSRRLGVI